jgi:hypothetical protein
MSRPERRADAPAAQRIGVQLQAATYRRGWNTRRRCMVPRLETAKRQPGSCNGLGGEPRSDEVAARSSLGRSVRRQQVLG